jgi:hypothetical protein
MADLISAWLLEIVTIVISYVLWRCVCVAGLRLVACVDKVAVFVNGNCEQILFGSGGVLD